VLRISSPGTGRKTGLSPSYGAVAVRPSSSMKK
jgi:hypothetical protein